MAFSQLSLSFLFATFLLMQTLGNAATCTDCFIHSRAAYYPNSDEQGSATGACGFGTFGATINEGDVSAASELYRSGVGCGACYQVRCTNRNYCSDKGVTVVVTDQGSSHGTDFILSRRAFSRMAQTTEAAASLLALGVVDVEYRRVPCSYPGKNITFKIDENSNYPHYLAFVIWYQQGKKDITAVQLCEVFPSYHYLRRDVNLSSSAFNTLGVPKTLTSLELLVSSIDRISHLQTQNFACKLLDRSHGAVWTTASPPSGPLVCVEKISSQFKDS